MTKKARCPPCPTWRTASFKLADRQAGGALLELGAEEFEDRDDGARIGVKAVGGPVPGAVGPAMAR